MSAYTNLIVKHLGAYLCGIGILTGVGRILISFLPGIGGIIVVIVIVMGLAFTYGAVVSVVRDFKAKNDDSAQ
jgi:uncharacterized protein (DUF697 family)